MLLPCQGRCASPWPSERPPHAGAGTCSLPSASLMGMGEQAAATHPVTVATCRCLPKTWWQKADAGGEAELAWDKGTWPVHARGRWEWVGRKGRGTCCCYG